MKILLSGEGGQGIQVMAKIFAKSLVSQDYHVVLMPHYGVEMRMGISMAYLQVDDKEIPYPKFKTADILITMTPRDMTLTKSFAKWGTRTINGMNLAQVLRDNDITSKSLNMLVLGILTKEFKGKLPLDTGRVKENIKKILGHKKGLEKNLDAFMLGVNLEDRYYNMSLNSHPKINLGAEFKKDDKKTYYHWPSHCKGCGLCIEKCPVGALSWSKTKTNYFGNPVPEVDINRCIACGICEQICPDMAIKIQKRK